MVLFQENFTNSFNHEGKLPLSQVWKRDGLYTCRTMSKRDTLNFCIRDLNFESKKMYLCYRFGINIKKYKNNLQMSVAQHSYSWAPNRNLNCTFKKNSTPKSNITAEECDLTCNPNISEKFTPEETHLMQNGIKNVIQIYQSLTKT